MRMSMRALFVCAFAPLPITALHLPVFLENAVRKASAPSLFHGNASVDAKKAARVSRDDTVVWQSFRDIDPLWFAKISGSGLFVGCVFGMMGGGGSNILKPTLYYGFYVRPFKEAIFQGYTILFLLSAAATLAGHRKGQVDWKTAVPIGLTTGVGSMFGAGIASMVSSDAQLLCFALFTASVSIHMSGLAQRLLPSKAESTLEKEVNGQNLMFRTAMVGVGAGVLSGYMGIGGGFILVPALCGLGLPMEKAVPTSQAVVTSLAFLGSCYYMCFMGCSFASMNVPVVVALTLMGLCGVAVSSSIASRVSTELRRTIFAGLLFMIAVGMLCSRIAAAEGRLMFPMP
jgi:uncharacterized membrane protein YfcA